MAPLADVVDRERFPHGAQAKIEHMASSLEVSLPEIGHPNKAMQSPSSSDVEIVSVYPGRPTRELRTRAKPIAKRRRSRRPVCPHAHLLKFTRITEALHVHYLPTCINAR